MPGQGTLPCGSRVLVGIGLNGNGTEGDDPCNGCFGAAENACQKCEKKRVNTNVTGRSADNLRERLNFIKKYI